MNNSKSAKSINKLNDKSCKNLKVRQNRRKFWKIYNEQGTDIQNRK